MLENAIKDDDENMINSDLENTEVKLAIGNELLNQLIVEAIEEMLLQP